MKDLINFLRDAQKKLGLKEEEIQEIIDDPEKLLSYLDGRNHPVIVTSVQYEKLLGYNPHPESRPTDKTEQEVLDEASFVQALEAFLEDFREDFLS